MTTLTVKELKDIYIKNYAHWEEVNIGGIRDEENQEKDLFNDIIWFATDEEIFLFTGTTDPGKWWTQNPVTASGVTGAAHLCEGFHSKAWRVGVHSSKTAFAHEALVQTGNTVSIWRDTNSDYKKQNSDPIQKGWFGINIHRAGIDDPNHIGKYSAGCQVVKNHLEFLEGMKMIKNSKNFKKYGSSACFSYLLVNKKSM